jgi:hypothetical protein
MSTTTLTVVPPAGDQRQTGAANAVINGIRCDPTTAERVLEAPGRASNMSGWDREPHRFDEALFHNPDGYWFVVRPLDPEEAREWVGSVEGAAVAEQFFTAEGERAASPTPPAGAAVATRRRGGRGARRPPRSRSHCRPRELPTRAGCTPVRTGAVSRATAGDELGGEWLTRADPAALARHVRAGARQSPDGRA